MSIFTIKLIGIVSESEISFNNLNQNDIPTKACLLFEFKNSNNKLSASVKMAFVTMMLSVIEHRSGQYWVEKTGNDF